MTSQVGGRRLNPSEDVPDVRQVPLTDAAAGPLCEGLAEEYFRRYGVNDEMTAYEATLFEPPGGCFLVLQLQGKTVAGGGFRCLDATTAEVKRMWTSQKHRSKGFGRQVLVLLEGIAAERGYRRVRLETGTAQPEAIALYRSAGYTRIEGYGRYRNSSDSISFEKALS